MPLMLRLFASCSVQCEHTWKTARTDRPLGGFRTVPWLDFALVQGVTMVTLKAEISFSWKGRGNRQNRNSSNFQPVCPKLEVCDIF